MRPGSLRRAALLTRGRVLLPQALGDPCPNVVKTLAVRASCSGGTTYAAVGSAVVSIAGSRVWDGTRLVGVHPGISHGVDVGDGVAFETSNGLFSFEATPV